MNNRVLVAMSGGVDSSVAALLLQRQGYQVVGVTMQLWHDKGASKSCCSHTDINDARLVADRLGIPHYVFDYEKDFKTTVVDYFAAEYRQGRTPNPCVMCNSRLKFSHLIQKADAIGASWVATGHYAGIVHDSNGLACLVQAKDNNKDQSYFLFNLRNDYLARLKFPLHQLTKDQVRALAREQNLINADKAESQDICFVGGKDYREFIEKNYQSVGKAGQLKTADGQVVGQHTGIHRYTVGQRKGLGVALGKRQYVTAIDAHTGEVTLGDYDDLVDNSFTIDTVRWLDETIGEGLEVMSRYRGPRLKCRVEKKSSGDRWQVTTQGRVLASPGQAAVFYRGEQVIGGGLIVAS